MAFNNAARASGGVGLQKSEAGGVRAGVIAGVPFVSSDGDLPGGEDTANADALKNPKHNCRAAVLAFIFA